VCFASATLGIDVIDSRTPGGGDRSPAVNSEARSTPADFERPLRGLLIPSVYPGLRSPTTLASPWKTIPQNLVFLSSFSAQNACLRSHPSLRSWRHKGPLCRVPSIQQGSASSGAGCLCRPHSRALLQPHLTHSSRCGLQYAAGYAGSNVETPGKGSAFPHNGAAEPQIQADTACAGFFGLRPRPRCEAADV